MNSSLGDARSVRNRHRPRLCPVTRRFLEGADLKPVLGALAGWAMRHVPRVEPDKELAALLRR